jgi:hypothetical protein
MHRFFDSHIQPLLHAVGAKSVVEVGAAEGAHTRRLLDYVQGVGGELHVVDVSPSPDLLSLRPEIDRVGSLLVGKSVPALGALPADVYLLDGDHNWFTVREELRLIAGATVETGRPWPLVLLHDVGWPYGHRDQYCNPADIPANARQPMDRRGVRPGHRTLVETGGLNHGYLNAVHEGGPDNGVHQAVSDFMAESSQTLTYEDTPAFHGLGVLYSASALGEERTARVRAVITLSAAARDVIERLEAHRIQAMIADLERPRCLSWARLRLVFQRRWRPT